MIRLVRLEHLGAAVITGGTSEQAAHRNNRLREGMALRATVGGPEAEEFLWRHAPISYLGWWIVVRGSIFTALASTSASDCERLRNPCQTPALPRADLSSIRLRK